MLKSRICYIAVVLAACRSAAISGAPTAGEQAASAPAPVAVSATSSSAFPAPPVASGGTPDPDALPHLQPISAKIFPDDPSDDVLCAAIHSTETNLWERFGHFLPLYLDGVIWVGDGSDAELKAVQAAIADYAPRLIYAEARRCSRGGVLLYAEGWTDATREALGKKYSLAELETVVAQKAVGAERVLRQHVVLHRRPGEDQLMAICAQSPDTCEALLGLHLPPLAPPTRGLCLGVYFLAQEAFADPDRSWSLHATRNMNESKLVKACGRLKPEEKVCATITPTRDRTARRACWRQLATKMGL